MNNPHRALEVLSNRGANRPDGTPLSQHVLYDNDKDDRYSQRHIQDVQNKSGRKQRPQNMIEG